jgi:hypothetical protein
MKKLALILTIGIILNVSVFADENDINRIIRECIYQSIEWKYISSIEPIIGSIINPDKEKILVYIGVQILFNAGVYELKDYFYDIIENNLLIEIENIFPDIDISISPFFPFSIILINDTNYELDEIRNITDEIHGSTHGIFIEHIFKNSMYGYVGDRGFANSLESMNRANRLVNNNFNEFLEILYKYYGMGNIICF